MFSHEFAISHLKLVERRAECAFAKGLKIQFRKSLVVSLSGESVNTADLIYVRALPTRLEPIGNRFEIIPCKYKRPQSVGVFEVEVSNRKNGDNQNSP
jgi:hypothetical protein